MIATNHALTGAIIVLALDKPALALPLALVSHFVLDALPHYGNWDRAPQSSKLFLYILMFDAAMAMSVMLLLFTFLPSVWLAAVAGSLLAMSPDLMWFPNYLRILLNKPRKELGSLGQWHKRIQWGERPWGVIIEIGWFVGAFWLMLNLSVAHL